MGALMAHRLRDAGNPMVILDTRRAATEPFLAKGAKAAGSASKVAFQVDAIFLSLPTPSVVRAVTLGKAG